MSDMFHMKAIKMIFKYLPAAVNEKDEKAIENMGLAQYIAGMGFSNVGLGIVHSMTHQLGAVYDTPHGIATVSYTHLTLIETVNILDKFGSKNIYAAATHGILAGEAIERIKKAPIKELVVTRCV